MGRNSKLGFVTHETSHLKTIMDGYIHKLAFSLTDMPLTNLILSGHNFGIDMKCGGDQTAVV